MNFRPRDYQKAVIEWIAGHARSNVWAGMGTGKTAATLTALDALTFVEDPFPALVLAPLRVANSTWPGEVRKWGNLHGLQLLNGSGTRDFGGVKVPDVLTVNYDNVTALVNHFGGRWPFRTVVADESTRLKSFRPRQGAKRAGALGRVAHSRTRRWVNLTGTPAPNGYADLWGQQWFVDAGDRLGRTFDAFERRWFAWRRSDPKDPFKKTRFLVPGAEQQINELLRDCTITVRASDFLDLPPLIENVIEVELPAQARRHYRELEREMFTVLSTGEEVSAVNAAGKTMKCLQAANGALYINDQGAWQELHGEKVEALRSVVEEAAGMPVLVAYHFKSDLARLRAAFPAGRVLDANPRTLDDWNAGKVPLLFVHPAAAGHGLNLQHGGNILVFFGLWWDLEQHEQVIERIGPTRQAQSGYKRPVYVHRIVARRTVDELVLRRLETKASVQDILLAAMKERG